MSNPISVKEVKQIQIITIHGDIISKYPGELSESTLCELCGNSDDNEINITNVFEFGARTNASSKIQQIVAVFLCMFQGNESFQEGITTVSSMLGLTYSSIADKCTRKLNKKAAEISAVMKDATTDIDSFFKLKGLIWENATKDDHEFLLVIFEQLLTHLKAQSN